MWFSVLSLQSRPVSVNVLINVLRQPNVKSTATDDQPNRVILDIRLSAEPLSGNWTLHPQRKIHPVTPPPARVSRTGAALVESSVALGALHHAGAVSVRPGRARLAHGGRRRALRDGRCAHQTLETRLGPLEVLVGPGWAG